MGFGRALKQGADPLVTLRYLIATFAWAILAIGAVVAILGDMTKGAASPERSIVIIVAAGLASFAAQAYVRPRLDCTSAKALAESYRTRFFLRIAFSESVALLAFALGISWGPWWIYYVGALFTLVGFWMLAPTRRNLQAEQDRLSMKSCQLSLTAALRTPAS